MRLFLVQHGKAKSKVEDPERPLSEQGVEEIEKMAKYAKHYLNIEVKQILHSGKLRAKQTAEILAKHLSPPKKIVVNAGLEPLADPKILQSQLTKITEDILIVGHLPHLSKLTSVLLTSDEKREIITFRNGGIINLERGKNHWSIEYIITPDTIP
jgi:phosphohistidine phosphatase